MPLSSLFLRQFYLSKALYFRKKSVISIKFPPVILGPEMAAPILWAPGIFWFFLLENPHAHKIHRFRGGVVGFFRRGGVEVLILFLWAWGFFRMSRKQNRKFSARNFCCTALGSWTSAWTSAPQCLFFQGFEGVPIFLDPGRPREWPWGYPAQKHSLWAAFSFLNFRKETSSLLASKTPPVLNLFKTGPQNYHCWLITQSSQMRDFRFGSSALALVSAKAPLGKAPSCLVSQKPLAFITPKFHNETSDRPALSWLALPKSWHIEDKLLLY